MFIFWFGSLPWGVSFSLGFNCSVSCSVSRIFWHFLTGMGENGCFSWHYVSVLFYVEAYVPIIVTSSSGLEHYLCAMWLHLDFFGVGEF